MSLRGDPLMALWPRNPQNLALEQVLRRIWEALQDSMDAYVLNTGGERPFKPTSWSELSDAEQLEFAREARAPIACLIDAMDDIVGD